MPDIHILMRGTNDASTIPFEFEHERDAFVSDMEENANSTKFYKIEREEFSFRFRPCDVAAMTFLKG
ncbi:hypothetical protein RPALISO_83 [Ruegeria phage RpAliso]|nr:hypothetical protein RPALISO_83 [Ruegeria phage RpAliso]